MQYRDHEFRYEDENSNGVESQFVRDSTEGKSYRQKRSARPKRRRAAKATHPGCGMGARRNRRWTW
jgi:hypothetical protein